MNLIEIIAPAGAYDADDRAAIAADVTGGLLGGGSAPEATLKRARVMTHVWFREGHGWTTGDGPYDGTSAPPVVATVTVPEAWRAEVSRYIGGVVRTALRRRDERHGRTRAGGDLWVNVTGIADGSIGLDGRAGTAGDVLDWMTAEYRAGATAPPADLPDGVVVDPVCGMHVRLRPGAITLDHDGRTLGFCSEGCRRHHALAHGIELPG
jgi:YHS domain-containing protein